MEVHIPGSEKKGCGKIYEEYAARRPSMKNQLRHYPDEYWTIIKRTKKGRRIGGKKTGSPEPGAGGGKEHPRPTRRRRHLHVSEGGLLKLK